MESLLLKRTVIAGRKAESILTSLLSLSWLCLVFTAPESLLQYSQKLSQYSVWLRTGRPGFDPRQRQRVFPLTPASRPALGPTQPPVQWVPGALSLRVKRGRGVMLTTHPLLVPRLRKSRSYTYCRPDAPLWSATGPLYVFLPKSVQACSLFCKESLTEIRPTACTQLNQWHEFVENGVWGVTRSATYLPRSWILYITGNV
jgi:hypothetical protein